MVSMSNLPRSLVNYSLCYLPTDVLTEHIRDRFTRQDHTLVGGFAFAMEAAMKLRLRSECQEGMATHISVLQIKEELNRF